VAIAPRADGDAVSLSTVVAAAVFAGLGFGVVVLVTEVRGVRYMSIGGSVASRLARSYRLPGRRLAGAAVAGLVAAVVTRWPVAALAAAGLFLAWPSMFGRTGSEHEAIVRLAALSTWTESLRDTIAGAVGLEQAVSASVPAAHPSLRPHLDRLRGRLDARQPLPAALHQLAADLNDSAADLMIAALILNAGLRGPGLHATLTALATAAREEMELRRRVEAGRQGIRRGARIVVGATVGLVVLLTVFNREYLAPYGSPVGQLVLAGVVGIFAAGFGWLQRLSSMDLPSRFLTTEPATAARALEPTWLR
jgi:hypothetical protein